MTDRSIIHGSFILKRQLAAAPARVFAAFAEPEQKRRWFANTEGFTTHEYALDCREGGSEVWRGAMPGGAEIIYRARYADVQPGLRIVATHEMWMNGARISVSLETIELRATPQGCELILSEHGAHLDGHDTPQARQFGTEALLDALEAALAGGDQAAA